MYSVVMVVAMAGAPEVPSDCCFKDKFCCWKDKWQDKCGWKDKCGQKDYGRANDCAPVAVAPAHAAPVAVAPAHPAPVAVAPVYVQQSNGCDQGYSKKKCCFFSCCDKGSSNRGQDCGTVVVPPTVDAPKKDMPKVDPKGGKVGG